WVRIPRRSELPPAPGSLDALTGVCQESEPLPSRRLLQRSGSVPGSLASPVSAEPTGKPRLLIVEDNPDMRAYLMELLAPEYEVAAVANGCQALEAVSSRL